MNNSTRLIALTLIGITALAATRVRAADDNGADGDTYARTETKPTADGAARITVHIVDDASDAPLPVRVIVTASDQSHPDGSSRGVYRDGRFFADGSFTVTAPAGATTIELHSGPHIVPLTMQVDAKAGEHATYRARLHRWIDTASMGWYAGDNHVHTKHDEHGAVRTDLAYTALQGRANGLSFITEAGSSVSYEMIDKLDTPTFLLRYAQEQRPGPYVGHINTPGITRALTDDETTRLFHRPLPGQALTEAVHAIDGVTIHTHPMTPPTQLHWMGATEALSDGVLNKTTDLFDVDAQHTQAMWFALLNLGNRIGVSSYTDAALGRSNTLSPGDRRVYCRADRLDYRAIVDAMRAGRTCATNGGPVFAELDVEGAGPGDTLQREPGSKVTAKLTTHSLGPLRSAALYMHGRRVAAFNVQGKQGAVELTSDVTLPTDRRAWIVARCEDMQGNWWLSSPVYIEPTKEGHMHILVRELTEPAFTTILEISNASRFAQLRRAFFAHVIVTVRHGDHDPLTRVEVLKDGQPLRVWTPEDGDKWSDDRVPVTDPRGDYAPGWEWYPATIIPVHFQADWPVAESGWYAVRYTTRSGSTRTTDAVRFDASNPNSRTISVAQLAGADTKLTLRGYAEDLPLADIAPPYDRGGWWYPQKGWWRLDVDFADEHVTYGRTDELDPPLFRAAN
ncbi:MAG: hypothetical protein GC159_14590 [Phycisphaera sp.]|nr:hypothetical protein [Phycisphaera sp.]